MSGERDGAELLVEGPRGAGRRVRVLGMRGAKIDAVFNALFDTKIKTVVCRHEQNAAFIAGGLGRITGEAGVVLRDVGPRLLEPGRPGLPPPTPRAIPSSPWAARCRSANG